MSPTVIASRIRAARLAPARLALAAALAATVALGACGGGDDGDPVRPKTGRPSSDTYVGVVAGGPNGTESGTFTLTFERAVFRVAQPLEQRRSAASAPVLQTASGTDGEGTLQIRGGRTIEIFANVQGGVFSVFDTVTSYTMDGRLEGGVSTGLYGSPTTDGRFAAVSVSASKPATLYCGTFAGTQGGSATNGTFNIIRAGTLVVGVTADQAGTARGIVGTAAADGTLDLERSNNASFKAPGTIAGTTASGTFTDGNGGTGTWTATACG